MPSWTEPILDQLIIRFNASRSINYATAMWYGHIYLTPNSVEINTHVSTLHSMIRKQLSEIGQSTEWHVNTQARVGVQISLRYSNIKRVRLTSPQYPVAHPGHQQLSCWFWHSWPESSQDNHRPSSIFSYVTSAVEENVSSLSLRTLCFLVFFFRFLVMSSLPISINRQYIIQHFVANGWKKSNMWYLVALLR